MNLCTALVAIMQGVSTLFTTIVFEDSSTLLQAVIRPICLPSRPELNVYVSIPRCNSAGTAPVTVGDAVSAHGIVNAANFANASVTPGGIVTIFGDNIGPPNPDAACHASQPI